MNKELLAKKLEEAKGVNEYYLTGAQNCSLEASKCQDPQVELGKLSTLIHSLATKMGLVYKPPILESSYNACSEQLTELIKHMGLLASLMIQFQALKEKYSSLYVSELLQQFKTQVQCSNAFLTELVNLLDLNDDCKESGDRLIDVGRIWESCDELKKLSTSGSSNILKGKIKESYKLVVDALEELDEWIENPHMDNESDDGFDEFGDPKDNTVSSDKEEEIDDNLIEFAKVWNVKIKLVKLLMSTLDKSIPKPSVSAKFGTTIDSLNERRLQLNEFVDDVIASIVWDMDLKSAESASKDLTSCVNSVIRLISKLNDNDEKKLKWLSTWKVKFLEK